MLPHLSTDASMENFHVLRIKRLISLVLQAENVD